ncbi:MAG: dTDP-4-dehydrorhamnose 3,5-epimerase family protein [Gemmatimonadales bacterium]
MKFARTTLEGVFRVALDSKPDERGAFVRVFDAAEFERAGLAIAFPEQSIAINTTRGTVRGLHFQTAPHGETKVIRCTRGRVYDVLVDARRNASTFGLWEAFELSESSPELLYVPPGVAHGYQTLEDRCELHYLMSSPYRADAAKGIRFDDQRLGIAWPLQISLISERDRALPSFEALDTRGT